MLDYNCNNFHFELYTINQDYECDGGKSGVYGLVVESSEGGLKVY